MTKKSEGTKFLEKFINLREKDPEKVATSIHNYIEQKLHRRLYCYLSEEGGLLRQFFGQESFVLVLPPTREKCDVVLVGKGVCYDSGGYNIKSNMNGMHYDKNGALLALAAAIDTGVQARVFFVNNMIRPGSPVCGDILTEHNTGIKILIDDTDAEGRIGLASLLSRTDKEKVAITIATLTGAAVGVTGEGTYALVHSTKKSDYPKFMAKALSGSKFWPAPFHDKYDKSVKTKAIGADVHSCPTFKYAGSSTAFSFLKRFRKGHLIHLDIAAMMTDKSGNGLVWGIDEVSELIRIATSK